MILAIDVSYKTDSAIANAIVFTTWTDKRPVAEYSLRAEGEIPPYRSGQFSKRELPILLSLLGLVQENVTTVVIDGYVDLPTGPGLGRDLWERLGRRLRVVGVAKTPLEGAPCYVVHRSGKPLYVSAAGMGDSDAALRITTMWGKRRIPSLLKRVDRGRPLVSDPPVTTPWDS